MILLSSNNLEGNPLAFNVHYVVYLNNLFMSMLITLHWSIFNNYPFIKVTNIQNVFSIWTEKIYFVQKATLWTKHVDSLFFQYDEHMFENLLVSWDIMRRPQNLKKSPTCFYSVNSRCQNNWEIFSKFCSLFRKAGLYIIERFPAISLIIFDF